MTEGAELQTYQKTTRGVVGVEASLIHKAHVGVHRLREDCK